MRTGRTDGQLCSQFQLGPRFGSRFGIPDDREATSDGKVWSSTHNYPHVFEMHDVVHMSAKKH